MKLHLNKVLRAALIAAVTAAGFTLSQAQATITVTGALSEWTTYTDVKVGTDDHAITSGNNSLSFNQGQTTSLLNWSIEYKYVWDTHTITGAGATISLNNNSTSADNHLSALVLSEGSEYRLYIGHGSSDKKSEGYIVLSNTPGQVLTMSYAKDTDTLSITDQTTTISFVCSDYNETETTLTSGNVRLFTNGGKDKMYVNSVSGQYMITDDGVTVSAGVWSKNYATTATGLSDAKVDATLLLTSRLELKGTDNVTKLNSNGGDIVVGNSGQLFLQTWGGSAITLANDLYIGSSTQGDVGTWGVVRFGNDNHETTLGNIYLIEDSSLGANQSGGKAVNVNGIVTDLINETRGNHTLTIKRGQTYHFTNMDLTKLAVNSNVTMDFSGTVKLGELAMSNGDQITIKDGGSILVNKLSGSGTLTTETADLTIKVASGESVEYTGTLDVGGHIIMTGAGSQTIGDATLHHNIQAQGGTLTLNGTYEIKDIAEGEHQTVYVDASDQVNENGGFQKNEGKLTVYSVNTEAGANLVDANAVFTYNGVNVTGDVVNGEYTLPGAPDMSTLYVKKGNLAFAAYKAKAGENLTTVSLADGTAIDMNEAASINLVMENAASATVNATAATTLSSISGWTKTLTIDGTAPVSTGAVKLDGTDMVLTVAQGTTLNIGDSSSKANLTPNEGVVDINGTVNISHELDLANGGNAKGRINVGGTGVVNVADGMWMNNTAAISIAKDGTFNIGGLSIVGKDNGSIVSGGSNKHYGTGSGDFTINNATVNVTGNNVTIGNHLNNVDVVTGAHTVTLNSSADSVTVSDGGSFTLGSEVVVANGITVENGGTIAGGVNATDVTIKAGATGTFVSGVSDGEAGVYIYSFEGADPTITNNGQSDAKYAGLQDANMTVAAETLYSNAEDYTVKNGVAVTAITHLGSALTLEKVDAAALEYVDVQAGVLSMQNITSVTLTEMDIASEATVAVYQGDVAAAEQEGTVTITDTLTAGGGTLLANLTIEASEGDAFQWDLGGTTMTLGSTLTLVTTDGLIQLDDATMQNIAGLQTHESYVLVLDDGAGDLTYIGEGWWDQVFTRSYGEGNGLVLTGDYQVGLLDNGNFGVTKFSNVPEPTTGTLSLLALAALAARRRRK